MQRRLHLLTENIQVLFVRIHFSPVSFSMGLVRKELLLKDCADKVILLTGSGGSKVSIAGGEIPRRFSSLSTR